MGEDQSQTGRRRFTVSEAAQILGITVEAVRGRIKRGTLEHERDSSTVYVLLDTDQPRPDIDQTTDQPPSDSVVLTSELRDRLRYVEKQLEAERQAHAEARRIIAGLVERLPTAIEAPPEARESPEAATEGRAGTQVPPERQEGEIRRPWWRRLFGG